MRKDSKISHQTGKRILVILAILLLFPMVWVGYELTLKILIISTGSKVSATVNGKSKNGLHWIYVEYQSNDSIKKGSSFIKHEVWEATLVGDSIIVWHHPKLEGNIIIAHGDVSIRSNALDLGINTDYDWNYTLASV